MGNAYTIHFWLENLRRPLGRPRSKWEDNIKVYLREIGLEGVNWIHLAQRSLKLLLNDLQTADSGLHADLEMEDKLANNRSASQGIHRPLWNPKVH
jgi:hypothetical protein